MRGEQACFSRQECLDGSGAMEIPEAAVLRSDLNPSVGADYCTGARQVESLPLWP
jgi:hypothetical protein